MVVKASAFVFDFDGTLADTPGAVTKSLIYLKQKYYQYLNVIDTEVLKHEFDKAFIYAEDMFIRSEIPWVKLFDTGFDKMLKNHGIELLPHLVTAMKADFHAHFFQVFQLYNDAIVTLQRLHKLDYVKHVGILTNGSSHFQRKKIHALGLYKYVDTIAAAKDFDSFKPEAKIFTEYCKKFNLNPQDVCYIGDSIKHDVDGAINAGMMYKLIVRPHNNTPANLAKVAPHNYIYSLYDLAG